MTLVVILLRCYREGPHMIIGEYVDWYVLEMVVVNHVKAAAQTGGIATTDHYGRGGNKPRSDSAIMLQKAKIPGK